MPKIPVYEQQVELAAGSLGPRAGAGLEAPGQALASFGQQVGDIAFKYGMAEKEAETKAKTADFEADIVQVTSDMNQNNTETTTASAKQKYKNEVEIPMLQKLEAMDLTPNQKRDVKARIQRQLLQGSLQFQQRAADNGEMMRGQMVDNRLKSLQTQFATTKDPAMRKAIIKQADDLILDSSMRGDRITFSSKSWRNGAISEDVATGTQAAQTYQDFQELKSNVRKNTGYSQAEKAAQETVISQAETRFLKETRQRVTGEVFAAMLSEDEFNQAMEQASTGDILIKRDDEQIGISLAGVPSSERLTIVNSLRAQRNVQISEDERNTIESYSTSFANKTLSELQSDMDDLDSGEGFADGMSLRVRNSLRSIVDREIKDQAPRINSQIEQNTTAIKTILSANNGVPTEKSQKIVGDTIELLNQIDSSGVAAEELTRELQGFATAGHVYSSVRYSSDSAILQARSELRQKITDATSVEEINRAQSALEAFNSMVQKRQEEITNDPVDFLQREHKKDEKDEQAELTTEQLIAKQVAMGKPDMDIRILSNAEVTTFKTQFEGLGDDYSEKAKFATEFLSDYLPQDQNRIMRNLMKDGAITLVDSLIIANPNNARMFVVNAANLEASVEAMNQRFTSTQRREMSELVSSKNTEYVGSLLGGEIQGMVSRGATSARMLHASTINSIITNTALYMKAADGNLGDDEAVDKAIDIVIGSQFSFGQTNGRPLRFPKGMEASASKVSKLMENSLSDTDYLASIIDVPADSPFVDKEKGAIKYASELAETGYWVTTTDNRGAYLVDQNGNMVPRKIAGAKPGVPTQIGPSDAFVTVKFADVLAVQDEITALETEMPAIGTSRPSFTRKINALKEGRFF